MKWLWLGSWMVPKWWWVTRKTKPWLIAWNFYPCSPLPYSPIEDRGAGSRVNVIDHAYMNKLPKIPRVGSTEHFEESEQTHLGRECIPLPWDRRCCPQDSLRLCTSSSGCSSESSKTSFNKQVNVSKCFREFCELLKQINWTQEEGLRNLQFVAKSDRSWG